MVRENPARRLDTRLWFSLCLSAGLVILHPFLIQPWLVQLTSDAPIINLAGRQRMLSQKLAKEALAFLNAPDAATREARRTELSETLNIWRSAHSRLLNESRYDSDITSHPELQSGYQRLAPHFQAIDEAATVLTTNHGTADQQAALQSLLLNEPEFLREMHSLVGVYEDLARGHVRQLQFLGLVIMVGILGALLLMQFRVMRPELNNVQRAWEKKEAHYELLVESMTDGLVVIDGQENVEFSNRRFGEMLGLSSENLIGQPLSRFISQIDHSLFHQLLTIDQASHPVDLRLCRLDGVEVDTMISPRRLNDANGQLQGLLLVVTDTSQRKLIEQRSQELQSQLVHFSRLKSMGTMAAALAHEINQPLGAISNYAEGLLTRLADTPFDSQGLVAPLKAILQASLRGGEIVRRTRNFSRRRPFRLAPESINELIREMDELCRPEARRRSVVIELCLDDDLPKIWADGIQIQQVLINLIENAFTALEHTNPVQRKITLTTRRKCDATIEVSVRDNGPGVPAESSLTLFEPFTTTQTNGTGLGLTIARGIIDAHGGRIWNVPHLTGGADFRFELPIPTDSNDREQHWTATVIDPGQRSSDGRNSGETDDIALDPGLGPFPDDGSRDVYFSSGQAAL